MADMREKLEVIAHLGDHITYKEDIGICYDSELAKVIEDAYMTLKSGVTVQEWIPVTERLPAPYTPVLTCRQSFEKRPSIVKVDQMIYGYGDTLEWLDSLHTWKTVVTHWMPLPEPPKGSDEDGSVHIHD